MRRFVPWLGLLLLAVSFVWFIRRPGPMQPAAAPGKPLARPEANFVVVLDPGHGGQDSGAVCGATLEKDLTLDVALRAELLLRAAGFGTVLTRDSDRYVSLAERASLGNREDNSLFISIHFNDSGRAAAFGVETYYALEQSARPGVRAWLPFLRRTEAGPLTAQSQTLASCLQAALVARTSAADRGIKAGQFYVIANVRHPAVLVEGGFLTNKSDVTKLGTMEYRQQLAAAIGDGVNRYRSAIREGEPGRTLAAARPE
ncbi:MAG: N-acetylmuramoyl-L-alanine amidase [Chthoniobacterales bacterium]|jgi:N-acetylmuramoyl-L-alanine amidase